MSYFVGSTCDPDNQSRDGITSNAFGYYQVCTETFLIQNG